MVEERKRAIWSKIFCSLCWVVLRAWLARRCPLATFSAASDFFLVGSLPCAWCMGQRQESSLEVVGVKHISDSKLKRQ